MQDRERKFMENQNIKSFGKDILSSLTGDSIYAMLRSLPQMADKGYNHMPIASPKGARQKSKKRRSRKSKAKRSGLSLSPSRSLSPHDVDMLNDRDDDQSLKAQVSLAALNGQNEREIMR